MSRDASFLSLCIDGKVTPQEVDDFVDKWHEAPAGRELHEFLGMTEEEYSLWVRVPDALPYIVKARRNRLPLKDVVRHGFQEMRGAGSEARATIDRLQEWLKTKGEVI